MQEHISQCAAAVDDDEQEGRMKNGRMFEQIGRMFKQSVRMEKPRKG
jgi:hypothetical protein